MIVKQQFKIKLYYLIHLVFTFLFLSGCTIKKEVETFNVSADGPFYAKFKLDDRFYNSTHEWVYFEHEFDDFKQYKLITTCRSFKSKNNNGKERIIGDIRFVFENPVDFKDELFFELNDRNILMIKFFIGGEFYTVTTNENNTGYLKINLINANKNLYRGEFSAQLEDNELGINNLTEGELEFILE